MPVRSVVRFCGTAAAGVVLLSVAWVWIGPRYNQLLVHAVASSLPADASLEDRGAAIAIKVAGESLLRGTVTWVMHSWAMGYGLMVALAVLLTVPGLRLSHRFAWVAAALGTTFLAHLGGLLLLVHRTLAVASYQVSPDAIVPLTRTLTYSWLFIPSLLWVPIVLRTFIPRLGLERSRRQP